MKPLPARLRGLIAKPMVFLLAGLVCCGLGILTENKSTAAGQETCQTCQPQHPALTAAPRITQTHRGIPGDPINVALVGTQQQLVKAMLQAGWRAADPITLRSSLRIAASTVFDLSYKSAPVSNLYLWERKQDLAFEQHVGKGARRRHHVRFWRSREVDEQGNPLWLGAATYDSGIELSHTTGLVTHHIAPAIDADRDRLLGDLLRSGQIEQIYWIDKFHKQLTGRNGGGDPYYTDGRLMIGVLVPAEGPVGE